MSSADVRGALEKELAYTTVMTILTRLWQKGLAEREQQGRRFVYRPLLSEAELVARRMHCDLMRSSDHERALAKFVQGLSGPEVKMLRKLMEPRSSRSPRRS
ncbi:MAG: BlaI/MecI/CopY family transcriptional regulator [Actinomycetota bacterium]|nr:BlaI/MecI/CopY family transcriptional regulator [Actinomycetota bacterium]